MRDLIDELYATRRAVGAGTLPAGSAHVVTLSREYRAGIDDVWSALTTAERIARWFLPVSGDLRPGGTFQLKGNAGGEIRVCDPPRRLQLTWIMGEAPSEEDSSIVEVRLEATSNGTRLELEHAAVVPPEMWSQFGPGAVGVGWDLALLGLALHLAGLEVGDHEQLESDPEIRAATIASSEEWGKALAASGVNPEVVEQAVAATTSFYVPVR
jgi:uncharacterized protein YndB with AHSA1/START domain